MKSSKLQYPSSKKAPNKKPPASASATAGRQASKAFLKFGTCNFFGAWSLDIGTSRRPGFTLIELVIYIAITAIIVVVMTKVMIQVSSTREKTTTNVTLQQEMRLASDRIVSDMREAQLVNTGSSIFQTNSGSLSLAMSVSSRNPTLFFLSGSSIYVSQAGASTGSLTSDQVIIDQLMFTNLTATGASQTVKIEMHGTDAVVESDMTYDDEMTINTSVTLRK